MARLTDMQLVILSAASQRDDRGVELPANLKGAAARKVADKLIRSGLVEEVASACGAKPTIGNLFCSARTARSRRSSNSGYPMMSDRRSQ
jgi:hypothetical protein